MQENMAVGASSVAGLVANISYEMAALAQAAFPRNFVTDAAVLALLRLQRSDGSWAIADVRPPLGGDVLWTALCVRAVQAYAPPALLARRDAEVILLAVRWYLRYPLAYLHVAEILMERGVFIDASCIWRWGGPQPTGHRYRGCLLSAVLEAAGVGLGEKLRGARLTHFVLVEGSDDYRVLLSLAEVDPDLNAHAPVLAYEADGKPLKSGDGPVRLIASQQIGNPDAL
jgi:hypothetical protein